MSQFIDRRLNSKNKSAVNRQRFVRRFKAQIKRAVNEAAGKRSITDIERGEKVSIPTKDTSEPRLRHGRGGQWEATHTGNKEFVTGDRIKREGGEGVGSGGQASNSGSGTDEFEFELSREEFLELFFEDLALPNLVKTQLTEIPNRKFVRAGFVPYGTPANLSVIRSLRTAHTRRIAFGGTYKEQLRQAESQLKERMLTMDESNPEVKALKTTIENLRKKLGKIAFIDPLDLRYRNRIQQNLPGTRAVMFCLMDVSGSMDEVKKDIAKRFFILLYLFLTRNYEKIDLVFIRHHTTAKEVDEKEFFYSRETGGTVVSSALEKMQEIVQARYATAEWNIYAAQASDGDNWSADSPYCQELLLKKLMPQVQYYAYVEIMPRYHQSLWESYLTVKEGYSNFAMQTINELIDIYPVFRELFRRQEA